MSALSSFNRNLWLWLHQRCDQGFTSLQVAQQTFQDSQDVFYALHEMSRRRLIEVLPPARGSHRQRYAVTTRCAFPQGLTVGEVKDGPGAAREWVRAAAEITPTHSLSKAELRYLEREHPL